MNARAQIQGEEVIGLPGQNLTDNELLVLVSLAEGIPSPVIAERMQIETLGLLQIERSIQGKLAAKNKVHMITRGFTLGVLIPQALCVLLCFIAAIEIDQDFTRPKSQRRSRTFTEYSRCMRNVTSPAGGPPGRTLAFA